MSNLFLKNCQIDCDFKWRPGFGEVRPRLRVAHFPTRLVVTYFEDADEGVTRGLTLFKGKSKAPWRKVVECAHDEDFWVTINDDWPNAESIASARHLKFTPEATVPLKILALAWLGSQWNQAARILLELSDEQLVLLDERHELLDWASVAAEKVEKYATGFGSTDDDDEDLDATELLRNYLLGDVS